jgi:hypothetical protein
MHEKPKLQYSRDLSLFEAHEHNREQHEDKVLMASMQRVGFMPSSPLQCVRNGSGKLKVIRGHHRLDIAKRLGIGVWYIVDDSNTDLHQLEGVQQGWSVRNFCTSRASAGDPHCAAILAFQRAHGLTLGSAAALVGGESAGSDNKIRAIKTGAFKASLDQSHANAVVAVTDRCRELEIEFATSTAFVSAVSLALRVPEFDGARFNHRVALNPALMQKRSTVEGCLREIEALYNYGAKEKRLPLAFRAREIARTRQIDFGGPRIPRAHKR